jgi:hypothetical protein
MVADRFSVLGISAWKTIRARVSGPRDGPGVDGCHRGRGFFSDAHRL